MYAPTSAERQRFYEGKGLLGVQFGREVLIEVK